MVWVKLVLSPVHHPTLQAGLSGDQWQRSLQLLVQLERAAARGASCLLSALLPLPLACGTTLNHVPCACHRHTGIASGGTVAVLLLLRYHVHFCTLSTSISFERPLCTPPPAPSGGSPKPRPGIYTAAMGALRRKGLWEQASALLSMAEDGGPCETASGRLPSSLLQAFNP